jgi:hypothetical protein
MVAPRRSLENRTLANATCHGSFEGGHFHGQPSGPRAIDTRAEERDDTEEASVEIDSTASDHRPNLISPNEVGCGDDCSAVCVAFGFGISDIEERIVGAANHPTNLSGRIEWGSQRFEKRMDHRDALDLLLVEEWNR